MILPAGQAFAPFLAALPANRLEALKGTQKGCYSIRVKDQVPADVPIRGRDPFDVRVEDCPVLDEPPERV